MLYFLLLSLLVSSETPNKKLTHIPSPTEHVISSVGYYDILVRGGESITAHLSNGQNRLFIVIPSHPFISIEEIIIDDYSISEFVDKKGFIINGKENATFWINSTDTKSVLQINAWLLPNNLCSNSAIYTYGSHKIKYENTLSIPDFCIFSPTLDSKNNNFEIEYGIKNASKKTYTTSLYKSDFDTQLQSTIGEEIVEYESDGPLLIQFNFDNQANNETIIYERETKEIKFADWTNKCTINPFYRCSNVNNVIACADDEIGDFDVKHCNGLKISKWTLGLIIGGGCLLILIGIAGIVLCSCCCHCCACCCCNKYHQSRKNAKKLE